MARTNRKKGRKSKRKNAARRNKISAAAASRRGKKAARTRAANKAKRSAAAKKGARKRRSSRANRRKNTARTNRRSSRRKNTARANKRRTSRRTSRRKNMARTHRRTSRRRKHLSAAHKRKISRALKRRARGNSPRRNARRNRGVGARTNRRRNSPRRNRGVGARGNRRTNRARRNTGIARRNQAEGGLAVFPKGPRSVTRFLKPVTNAAQKLTTLVAGARYNGHSLSALAAAPLGFLGPEILGVFPFGISHPASVISNRLSDGKLIVNDNGRYAIPGQPIAKDASIDFKRLALRYGGPMLTGAVFGAAIAVPARLLGRKQIAANLFGGSLFGGLARGLVNLLADGVNMLLASVQKSEYVGKLTTKDFLGNVIQVAAGQNPKDGSGGSSASAAPQGWGVGRQFSSQEGFGSSGTTADTLAILKRGASGWGVGRRNKVNSEYERALGR